MFNRRRFLRSTSSAAIVGGVSMAVAQPNKRELDLNSDQRFPKFISTWNFGKAVNDAALKAHNQTGQLLDAIEQGIWVAEADASNGSVGLGGIPNADGVVQLDACIINGPDHNAGAVGGLEDILHPISVARSVMEKTKHVMLVGEGAREYALKNGFQKTRLLTDSQKKAFLQRMQKTDPINEKKIPEKECLDGDRINENHHDTIALVGVDDKGNIVGGCSTSGWGYKIPGRVGDSPIIGAGIYVDNEIGGAGATGIGENVMRYCASFMIVEEMRHGASPQESIENVIQRISQKDPRSAKDLAINFVAINCNGETGAAGTSKGFQYAVTDPQSSQVHNAKALTDADIKEGGNRVD